MLSTVNSLLSLGFLWTSKKVGTGLDTVLRFTLTSKREFNWSMSSICYVKGIHLGKKRVTVQTFTKGTSHLNIPRA